MPRWAPPGDLAGSPPEEEHPITDAELVSLALGGSPDAFRRLVERYQKPVLSVIARMVRDPVLAEDLAQETFVKAYRKLARYDPARKLSSWLFKIAHNTTLDHLRRKRLPTVPLEIPTEALGESASWEVLEAPEEQAPDRVAARGELVRALDEALMELKPHYREILLLRFQEGLAYQEIADVTGLKMGTVKVHLHRARKQLATRLAERGYRSPERFLDDA